MPQLDPAPWLMTLITSWVIFLAALPPKVLNQNFPAEPGSHKIQDKKALKLGAWSWSWQ
uniref:ATP synthase complex subunit 8 n=1 Tax=Trachinops taeniatus TaxID=1040957 RepID=I1T2G6_9TELE|nr:ATP synthase F0 subunit 8 [Trachinops taeniatus]AEK53188.1 ATP synthase F0 subunit 8 [Trachinops taeniatus]